MAKKKAAKSAEPKYQASGLPEGLKPEDLKVVDAPAHYASGLTIQGTGTEFLLVFTRSRPTLLTASGGPGPVAISEPVFTLSLSPQSLKEMSLVIRDQVEGHEKKFGTLQTPFVRDREANSKTKH